MSRRLEIDWNYELGELDLSYVDGLPDPPGPLFKWDTVTPQLISKHQTGSGSLGQITKLEDALVTGEEPLQAVRSRVSDLIIARNLILMHEDYIHFGRSRIRPLIGFAVYQLQDDSTVLAIYRSMSFPHQRYSLYIPEIIAQANERFRNKRQEPFPNYPIEAS